MNRVVFFAVVAAIILMALAGCGHVQPPRVTATDAKPTIREAQTAAEDMSASLPKSAATITREAEAVDRVAGDAGIGDQVQPHTTLIKAEASFVTAVGQRVQDQIVSPLREALAKVAKVEGEAAKAVAESRAKAEASAKAEQEARQAQDAAEAKAKDAHESAMKSKLNTWAVWLILAAVAAGGLAVWVGISGNIRGAITLGLCAGGLILAASLLYIIVAYLAWIITGASVIVAGLTTYLIWSKIAKDRQEKALGAVVKAVEKVDPLATTGLKAEVAKAAGDSYQVVKAVISQTKAGIGIGGTPETTAAKA